jgi:hypothetical protein
MKVIFEPLPQQSFYKWLLFRLFRIKRTAENIVVGMNGKVLIIKRGVPVDVPDWVPEVASHAPEHMKYNCYVLGKGGK